MHSQPFDAHICRMGTAIKHPVLDRVKMSLVIFDIRALASECPDVKNYKWWLKPIWHRMLYSCTHTATVGVRGLIIQQQCTLRNNSLILRSACTGWAVSWAVLVTLVLEVPAAVWTCSQPGIHWSTVFLTPFQLNSTNVVRISSAY